MCAHRCLRPAALGAGAAASRPQHSYPRAEAQAAAEPGRPPSPSHWRKSPRKGREGGRRGEEVGGGGETQHLLTEISSPSLSGANLCGGRARLPSSSPLWASVPRLPSLSPTSLRFPPSQPRASSPPPRLPPSRSGQQ